MDSFSSLMDVFATEALDKTDANEFVWEETGGEFIHDSVKLQFVLRLGEDGSAELTVADGSQEYYPSHNSEVVQNLHKAVLSQFEALPPGSVERQIAKVRSSLKAQGWV